MKRALAFACVLLLGVGFASFAQFTGTWETEVEFYPAATTFTDFASFGSDLDVTYAVSDWEFSLDSSFSPAGLSAMEFDVEGVLGAFTLTAAIDFIPMALTSTAVAYDGLAVQSPSCLAGWPSVKYDSVTVTNEYTALFDDLKLEAEVSIAGVTFGGIFFLEGEKLTETTYASTEVDVDGLEPAETLYDGTATFTAGDAVTLTAPAGNGAGWKFWGSGSVGGMDVTANLWLNLKDTYGSLYSYYSAYVMAHPPLSYMFQETGYYSLVCEDCIGRFTGFDILLEGFSFACTDVAIFTSFDCCGWNGIKFLLEDIGLGCCWDIGFDMLIGFTTTSKSITLQPDLTIANACFTIDAELVYSGGNQSEFSIDGIDILGIGLSYTWNGVTFTSETSFDLSKNWILGSKRTAGLISSPTVVTYWIPDLATSQATFEVNEETGECDIVDFATVLDATGDGYYKLTTIACEKAAVWEYFEIAVDGDGCCGGGFDLSAAFYFGDITELTDLDVTYYALSSESATEYDTFILIYGDEKAAVGTGTDDITSFEAWEASASCDCCPCDEATCSEAIEGIKTVYEYTAKADARLFDWVQTSIEGSIGMSSNFDLTFGLDVSCWGWESLSVGFEFTF